MKRFIPLLLILGIFISSCTSANGTGYASKGINEKITIYKSSTCGCCVGYAGLLKKQGFQVETIDSQDIYSIKNMYNIPRDMESCHTSVIGNYFVEGHVPIEAIERLLSEKPDIDGIALPGMPSGSLGMVGRKTFPFEIYSIKEGKPQGIFLRL